MLRVALVLRSTEVHPVFFDLSISGTIVSSLIAFAILLHGDEEVTAEARRMISAAWPRKRWPLKA